MIVDCTEKLINFRKIHWGINKFRAEHRGDNPSYIIMSRKTKASIVDNYYFETVIRGSLNNIDQEEKLFGISVAYCDNLEYGEVDIV